MNASDKPVTVYVDTPEDTILRKLEWYRRGNEVSERQWRDVLAVLSVQPELDKTYLDAWARRLGIADLMAKAIAETSK